MRNLQDNEDEGNLGAGVTDVGAGQSDADRGVRIERKDGEGSEEGREQKGEQVSRERERERH